MSVNKKAKKKGGGYALFDVLYEDGSRSSNRKVPTDELGDGEDPVRDFIEAQDRKIAEASGHSRGAIKAISPAGR